MASIYQLKPKFQRLLRPLLKFLVKIGVSANMVTLVAMVISILTGLVLYQFNQERRIFFLIPFILFFRMALNAIDGMLAREFNMKTPAGAILNEVGDVISDSVLYLPFALVNGLSSTIIVLIVIFSIISEMTGVVAVQIGASRQYDGPMGKSDRAFVFGSLSILIGFELTLGSWVNYVLAFILILIIVTIINRSRLALKEIS